MSEREYIKFNTSVQVASNAQNLIEDDEGNIAAILELRLPDNIFPAENGNKKVDSVQMLTTKMRISMENTPIAQFDVDEDIATKLVKLKRSSNAAFITTSQMDLYPYVIKGDNQILPSKANSAFPFYKTKVLSIDISVWMGEDYTSLDTLYVHPNAPSSFAENIGRYQEPFQKGGVFTALNHLSNLVVKQYMSVKREDKTVSIFNVGSIEQMIQDGIESAMIFNNTNLENPLQYSIFFISEEAYNNNHFPPVEDDDFTKDDVDVENSLTLAEFGGMKAYFVKKIFGPDYSIQETDLPNIRYSVKPKVSFTEQKLRISYDTCPFVNNIPILWCNSYVNTFDNPLQLSMRDLYNEYSDGFKPPKRVYSYGVTKNRDESYFFTLKQSTINPINIVGNKDLRDTFSCLPWITVDTNTNGFFKNKEKAKYRIKEQMQEKITTTSTNVVRASVPEGTPTMNWRKFTSAGIDGRSIDSSLTANCLHYSFQIPESDINFDETSFNKRYPRTKRTNQSTEWGTETWAGVPLDFTSIERRYDDEAEISSVYTEMKTYNTYELNTNENFPSTDIQEIFNTPASSTQIDLPAVQRGSCGLFNINGEDVWILYDMPQGQWNTLDFRSWLPPVEPDFVPPPVPPTTDMVSINAYWNLPQTGIYSGKVVLVSTYDWVWWNITYTQEDEAEKTFLKQNVIETLTETSIDELLFNYLPNVDLDEKGRFYVLDGTTTNLDMGQQEVIEGPTNALFHITQVTTITEERNDVDEMWKGKYDGTPYTKTQENYYNAIGEPYLEYEYTLIDDTAPDTLTNRTNQRLTYYNVTTNPLNHVFTPDAYIEVITSAANRTLRNVSPLRPRTSVERSEWDTSSTTYPVGTTEIGPIYTPWEEINKTITTENITRNITHISRNNVIYLTFSNEYWADTSVPDIFKCIPDCPPDIQVGTTQRWMLEKVNERIMISFNVKTTSVDTFREERTSETRNITVVDNSEPEYYGNIRLNFEWDNIPIVVISPIQSIVLTLQGMNVSQEKQPINIAQPGGSSLISSIPVIENYYSLAQTLRDLHDELVVIKESYDDQATYTLNTTSGQERALRIMAQYITKDGRLHQIYIPPNGVYSLQLTFAISYYFTS